MPGLIRRVNVCAPRRPAAWLGGGLLALAIGFVAPAIAADEPTVVGRATPTSTWGDAVPLTRSGSWVGWDYGAEAPRGWTLDGHKLSASKGAADLLSGWSFADFELSFTATFSADAKLEILLPRVPKGDGLTLSLGAGGNDCGRITEGGVEKPLCDGAALAGAAAGPRRFSIQRSGATITVSAGDQLLGTASINPVRRFGLGLRVVQGEVSVDQLTSREPLGEPLITRDDLADWWTPSPKNKQSWKVENGELVCLNQDGNYLRTYREFGNFVVSFDYIIRRGGNSGIGIRTPHDGWPSGEGMELQITDEKPAAKITRHSPMAIYGNLEPLGRTARPDEWNRVVIKADGWLISAWMNGELVQHANTKRLPELSHRFLKGWIGFQDHNDPVRYKNVWIVTARDGAGLDAWYTPKADVPSQAVLERLMTPERLAAPQVLATKTASYTAKAGKASQQVVTLEGPGALLGWSIQDKAGVPSKGKIAFTFDGEAKPRLDCAPADVAKRFAPLGDDRSPIFTYAPFGKSLTIAARELTEDAVIVLDYARFDAPVETWRPDDSAAARGLIPALTYRREQGGWGKIRDFDPDPRLASPACDLAPGERKEVLAHEGSGVVQWLQLIAPPNVVDDKNLWLEIAVDGEAPVAAPARFYFPGLREGPQRFDNFLLTTTGGGFVNRLPIPFSKKIVVALKNAGPNQLKGLGLKTSVVERPAAETQTLWRLRGSFAARDAACEAFNQPGRLVMLVAENTPDELKDGRLAFSGAGAAQTSEAPTDAAVALTSLLARPKQGEDFAGLASGCRNGLAWRMFLLAPPEFAKAALTKPGDAKAGEGTGRDRLFLYYSPAK